MRSFSDMNEILDKWETLSESYDEAKDDYERLIRHYFGFVITRGLKTGCKNFASIMVIPYFLFSLRRQNVDFEDDYDAVVTAPNKEYLLNKEAIPHELIERYDSYKYVSVESNSLLSKYKTYILDSNAYEIALNVLKKYPNHPFMVLRVILQLGRVSALIHKYRPKAIIVTQAEQDFTSSIITMCCEKSGVKYVCVQHGEYCYNPSMAYVRFSEYYAWDEYTINNLELTNDKINFAHLYTPVRYSSKYRRKEKPEYFIAYYLSGEKEEAIFEIKDVLLKFENVGFKCKIRRHPRTMKQESIEKIFENSDVIVEDCSQVSIEDSLCDTLYVVSYRSTILTEAFYSSMNIVIDDVVGDIKLLARVHYANIERTQLRLSDLLAKYVA